MGEKTILAVERLTKSFGGLQAVKDLTFGVEQGEILGLIGPNGAGKTTVFNLIAGFERPDAGRVFLRGEEITGRPSYRICGLGACRTFQIVKPLPNMTVRANVLVGALHRTKDMRAAEQRADELVDFIRLGHRRQDLGKALGVGDRKRLEMARALATGPEVLLLDEVMGGLNTGEVTEMIDLIRTVRDRGMTIVLIEHNMRAIMALSDRICVLNHGEKLAEGNPEQIRTDATVIQAYLGHDK